MEDMTRNENSLPEVQAHLTDEELDEVLMELAEPAVLRHAQSCTACGLRVEEFREAMASFNQATLAWSEARANSLPAVPERTAGREWLPGGLRLTREWMYGGAAVAVLAMLITGTIHERTAAGSAGTRVATQTESDYFSSRQQEISNDNAMLTAISAELYQPVTIPATLSDGLTEGRRGASPLKQVRD